MDVVSGRDDTALVDATVELDNDLAGSVVVNLLELANVACGNNELAECSERLNVRLHIICDQRNV